MTTYQQYSTPQQAPRPKVVQVPVPQDSGGMVALRALAYILTSLASLLFIVLVIYGYVQFRQAQAAVEDLFGAGGAPSFEMPSFEAPSAPPLAPPPGN
jgi:hypothetical protein